MKITFIVLSNRYLRLAYVKLLIITEEVITDLQSNLTPYSLLHRKILEHQPKNLIKL